MRIGVQNIQATAYNGAPHTVYRMAVYMKQVFDNWNLAFRAKKINPGSSF